MNNPTVLCIVRAYDPLGNMIAGADVQAKLSESATYQGFTIPELIEGVTDEFGHCLLRLWPNALGSKPTNYKFTVTNPDSGKRKIVYASLPTHDVFLDEIASPNEGDWVDGGLGMPPPQSGGGNNDTNVTTATVTVGTTTTLPPGQPAKVTPSGTPTALVLNFGIPAGKDGKDGTPGLNGTGTIVVKQTLTGQPGTAATVVNTSLDPARAELVFTIPAGQPGPVTVVDPGDVEISPLPPLTTNGDVLTVHNGAAAWLPPVVSDGEGGTTTIIGTPLAFHGLYPWESEVVVPPDDGDDGTPDPGLSVMDATTLTAYRAAIAGAAALSKRQAAADSIIASMGSAQRMVVRRDGVQVLSADFTGAMGKGSDATNVYLTLSELTSVSPITPADNTSGTWTTTLSGGAGFARTLTFSGGADAAAAAGNGFNPDVHIIVPRSIDGLA
jgi:hypothetical protein